MPARRISQSSMKVLLVWILKVPNTYIEEEGMSLTRAVEALRLPYKIDINPERL